MGLVLVMLLVVAGSLCGVAVRRLPPSGKAALALSALPLPFAYLALPSC